MMRGFLTEICRCGLGICAELFVIGGMILVCVVGITPVEGPQDPVTGLPLSIALPPLAQFVADSRPCLFTLFGLAAILIALAFGGKALRTVIDGWVILTSSRRLPDEPWCWRAAWRRGTLPVVESATSNLAFVGVAFLLLAGLFFFTAILILVEQMGVATILLSLLLVVVGVGCFLFARVNLCLIVDNARWRRRLTPRLVAIPTKPGETLAVEFTCDPQFAPTEEFRVRLMNRTRGYTEVEATVEQSPGRIALRCDAIDGEFIAEPYVQRCEWQVWLSGPMSLIQYAVPVFVVGSDKVRTVPS